MESNKRNKMIIAVIVTVAIITILIMVGIILIFSQKKEEKKEPVSQYNYNETTNNVISNNVNKEITTTTISKNKELLEEPVVIFDKDNITLKATKMQYKNSSWTGEKLEVTVEAENKTNQDLVFRLIDTPQVNGWSCDSLTPFSERNISANKTQTFEIIRDTYGISKKNKENLKEFVFSFTISTPSDFMQNIEEKVLYTVKECKIQTSYYDATIVKPIEQNRNIGTSLYATQNLEVRATLEKTEDGGELDLIMLNENYTSPTPVSNREKLPTSVNTSSIVNGVQHHYTGDIDYTYLKIKKLKINGIEIGIAFKSGIYGGILKTSGNTASIENIHMNLKSEDLRSYQIEKIDNIELTGEVYKVEKYTNKRIVTTKIGQFENVIVK